MKPSLALLNHIAALAICLTLTQCAVPAGGSGSLPPATKDQPFVNSLGMKFVPMPGTNILMCTTETTVAQYQAAGMGYRTPPFSQGSNHPAVNVSWEDAKAWCAWLSKQEGRKYRLPTDAEWSAAVGTNTFPWGVQWPPPKNCGNYSGQEIKSAEAKSFFQQLGFHGWKVISAFKDKHTFTAPVGSYSPNALGIHDLGGNVWEWIESARQSRGGSWANFDRLNLESASRGATAVDRVAFAGFRCVVEQ